MTSTVSLDPAGSLIRRSAISPSRRASFPSMMRVAFNDGAWSYRGQCSEEGNKSLLNALPLDRMKTRISRPQVSEKMLKVIHIDGYFWSLAEVQVKGVLQRGLVD